VGNQRSKADSKLVQSLQSYQQFIQRGFKVTLPYERYRAIEHTEQFLMDLVSPQKTPRVPKEIRQRARSLLKHYPGRYHIEELSEARPDLLAREQEELVAWIVGGTGKR
jgi:hypothetical protein